MEIRISEELNSIINYAREEAMRTGSYGIGPDISSSASSGTVTIRDARRSGVSEPT